MATVKAARVNRPVLAYRLSAVNIQNELYTTFDSHFDRSQYIIPSIHSIAQNGHANANICKKVHMKSDCKKKTLTWQSRFHKICHFLALTKPLFVRLHCSSTPKKRVVTSVGDTSGTPKICRYTSQKKVMCKKIPLKPRFNQCLMLFSELQS